MPQRIHLGFHLGAHHLRGYLKSLEKIGVNHVALNLRFNEAETETTLKRLADEILPDFNRGRNEMQKTILITGATDGIGLKTAKLLASNGHRVLLHGRNPNKLEAAAAAVAALSTAETVETFEADLSRMAEVESLAEAVSKKHAHLDVLINNAGVYGAPERNTADGLEVLFAVNTIAPYLLTQRLLPLLDRSGRVVNLSSAAQSSVDVQALAGRVALSDGAAYSQSKLALTLADNGPVAVAVNPGSLLGQQDGQTGLRHCR